MEENVLLKFSEQVCWTGHIITWYKLAEPDKTTIECMFYRFDCLSSNAVYSLSDNIYIWRAEKFRIFFPLKEIPSPLRKKKILRN